MVLALRTLRKEDGDLVRDFLQRSIAEGESGIAYAIADVYGNIIASDKIGSVQCGAIDIARLRAVASIVFKKNTGDIKTTITGSKDVDDIYSGGGVLVIANGAICGSIGIAGRPTPEKKFPGKLPWDSEIAFQTSEYLKGKLNLEEFLN